MVCFFVYFLSQRICFHAFTCFLSSFINGNCRKRSLAHPSIALCQTMLILGPYYILTIVILTSNK